MQKPNLNVKTLNENSILKKCYNEFTCSYPKDFNPASTYQRVHVRFSWKKVLLFGLVC